MVEYIEREATLKEAESRIMWGASAMAVYETIQEAPAADVAPVRHGRWIIDSVGGKIACSDCGCIYLGYNGRLTPNYCPNCGAKMMEG
ncbi:MAG: hypothetical protein MR004_00735 [Clostridiales bacterium]|nr:hypothetical protein [Clostridiales bacterium]MDY4037634.1 hypothetical protein [Candidatus Pseudoscilispira sp.]